jgi:hypothetical protein
MKKREVLLNWCRRVLNWRRHRWVAGAMLVIAVVVFSALSYRIISRKAAGFDTTRRILGVYLDDNWSRKVSHFGSIIGNLPSLSQHDQNFLWSTYSGLFEASLGIFNPSSDYIIHALGPAARRDYVNKFKETAPRFVITGDLANWYFEEWLYDTTWDFYEHLLIHYRQVAVETEQMLWRRDETRNAMLLGNWQLERGPATRYDLDLPESSMNATAAEGAPCCVYSAELTYVIHNPYSGLPVIGGLPRYAVIISGGLNKYPVSLPPYETTFRFPIFTKGNSRVSLSGAVVSPIPGVSFEFEKLKVRFVPVDQADYQP